MTPGTNTHRAQQSALPFQRNGAQARGSTYSLQLILPELLLLGLVQEREVAHMVYEYVAKNRELGVLWGYLALVGAERGPESLESGGR